MSIEIVKQTDYDVNFDLLLEQFKDSDNLKNILSCFNTEMEKVEDALFEIRDNFYLAVAEGDQLDTIGLIFNESREGRSDDDYRDAIQAKAERLYSGTPEGIYEQLRLLYGATNLQYSPPATGEYALYYMSTDAVITEAQLEVLSPAGVSVLLGLLLALENGDELVFENGDNILTTYTP